jgi:peptidoglycan/xylan/chitin deacetylase (PgdA/CDA1 family)
VGHIQNLPGNTGISVKNFKIHCMAVKYCFLPLYKFIYGFNSKIILTFDDGYADNYYNVLKIIKKYDLHSIFFISVSKIGSAFKSPDNRDMPVMDPGMIRTCADSGFEIASHGFEHRYLDMLSSQNLYEQMLISRVILEKITGKRVNLISYPFGKTDPRVIETAQRAGYKSGFIVGPGKNTLSEIDKLDNFTIERTSISGDGNIFMQLIKIMPGFTEIRRALWGIRQLL